MPFSFHFFFFLNVCHPIHYCFGVRGRDKAMALQRNVVYTLTKWVEGWMLLIQKPMSAGWSRSWTLVESLFCFLFFLCVSVNLVFCQFSSSCTGEKGRGAQKSPADMKTVRYCFVTCVLYFLKKNNFSVPLLSSGHVLCEATLNAVGTTQRPFSWCFLVGPADVCKKQRSISRP